MSEQQTITGWHFAGAKLRDGRPLPRKGETLTHKGAVVPCESGFHLSERAIDALGFAPGLMVARVRGGGVMVPHGDPVDKRACETRTCLSEYVNARAVIVELAETWVRRALRIHAAPAMRAAGLIAEADTLASLPADISMDAASAAASDAARAASNAAARAAARDAWDAARAARAASNAASDAARAASNAASAAASDAWDAARAASYAASAASDASAAARAAARAASEAAEKELQNTELETALMALEKRETP